EEVGLVGLTLGNALARGSFLAPALSLQLGSLRNARDTVPVVGSAILGRGTAAPGGPAVANLMTAFALTASRIPPLPPREKMRANLLASLAEQEAVEVLVKNLNAFGDELGKKKGRPAEARAYIQKAVKDYHLQSHAMPGPMTQSEVVEALN